MKLSYSYCCYRLQKFKLLTANTVISGENASMETMGTDQVYNCLITVPSHTFILFLPHNTNYITHHHLELAYQFILSSNQSPGIHLRWFPFNFPPSCLASTLVALPNLLCGAVFTMCSHTFTLFWSRKTSVIIKTFQLSFHVFMCVFHLEISSIFQ